MIITLELKKTFTIDLDAEANKDIKEMIVDRLAENEDNLSDGEVVLDSAVVHDEVREILSDDIDSLLDLDIDETDFEILITEPETAK